MATDSNGDYIPGSRLSTGVVSQYAYKNSTSFIVVSKNQNFRDNFDLIDWSKNGREDESKDTDKGLQEKRSKKQKGKGKAKNK